MLSGKQVPVIPKIPDDFDPYDNDPNPVVAVCGQCGLQIRQVMMYVCGHPSCPTGLGGATFCDTNRS